MVGDLEREKIGRGRDVIDHTAQRHVPYMYVLILQLLLPNFLLQPLNQAEILTLKRNFYTTLNFMFLFWA